MRLFSDYDKANILKNDIDNNTSLLYNTKQEQNESLIFNAPSSEGIHKDSVPVETPSFDMDTPLNDWEIPNPDDITTFDGIRGELKNNNN